MRILSPFGQNLCLQLNRAQELKKQNQAWLYRSKLALRLYLTTVTGELIEISEFQPLSAHTTLNLNRWENHGRPPGGDNSAIADTGAIRAGIVFTIRLCCSSSGDLYEFDKKSKPSWKKHIWSDPSIKQTSLGPSRGCTLHGLTGAHSSSLFLLTKVALRKFQWKDCHSPPDTKIAFIVDQEAYRKNIIFVVGQNGCLYQYNRITELWHKHYQSPHLVLSRSPGTAIRPSVLSLAGSIFMISDNGGLVEYQWDSLDGWEWVEHGTPYRDVLLVGAPGPCFDDTQLFVIGSDGQVYRRHWDRRTWKWTCHGFPHSEPSSIEEDQRIKGNKNCATDDDDDNVANHKNEAHYPDGYSRNCNEKVAAVRPTPFSEDSVIFELKDGRVSNSKPVSFN
ncbi:hypothetical protein BHE74_00008573 [Ensete ventricosum]|nr:hypothetical protein GW17_00013331 [Ensete ventricosum]RWW82944.1 hypothetical protein BHE74_00008573 [Ensete ventricosum]